MEALFFFYRDCLRLAYILTLSSEALLFRLLKNGAPFWCLPEDLSLSCSRVGSFSLETMLLYLDWLTDMRALIWVSTDFEPLLACMLTLLTTGGKAYVPTGDSPPTVNLLVFLP